MDSDDDNSNMFKVDHSESYPVNASSKIRKQQNNKKLDNFFNKDTEIHKDGIRKKFVLGAMEEQPRSVYQILSPYLATIASTTGSAATTAGKGLYEALTLGAGWLYDKLVNNVIPYTQEQLPKLIFVIKGKPQQNECKHYSSENFHVLEINEEEYEGIAQQKANKNGKKRVVVPLDPNDKEFAKFLEKQNYVADYSFPIDMDDDEEQEESYLIPSANFMVLHEEAKQKNKQMENINEKGKDTEKEQVETVVEAEEENGNVIKSVILEEERKKDQEESLMKKVEDYKKVPPTKKVFKMKDFYIFELEGQNSIEYDLLDNIQRDEHTQSGMFMLPEKVILKKEASNESSNGPASGEVPMIVEMQGGIEQNRENKVVDAVPRVRVQIPSQNELVEKRKVEEREIQYA